MIQKRKNTKNKRSFPSHLRASLSYVAPHKHTGHRLHARHTSHGALLLLLILVGIILFLSLASLEAAGITRSGQVTVTLTVPGTPPTTGAVINTPAKKSKMKQSIAQVSGTCPSGNVAAVYNNGTFASSTVCTTQNSFQTNVQLKKGVNTLQAQNYDGLNQPGPATEQIEIAFEPDVDSPPAAINTDADITLDPSIPDILAPQPSENPCYNQVDPEATTELGLIVSCVTRNIFIGEKIELPVTILGGIGPYALLIDWGDDQLSQLYSFPTAGRQSLSHTYLVPRVKNIFLHVADASGQTYQMQSVVDVNEDGSTPIVSSDPLGNIGNTLAGIWLEASIPVYWAAVALFAGFWVGDLFQRFLGLKKTPRRHA